MTRPSEPGQPWQPGRSPGPRGPGGQGGQPYGPPPSPGSGQPWPSSAGQGAPQGWTTESFAEPGHNAPPAKGFFGALLDTNFEFAITPKLIKLFYTLALAVITLFAFGMLILAWSFADWNMTLGFVTLLATPIVWVFNIVILRMFLEFLINQFKITEELRKLRQGEGPR